MSKTKNEKLKTAINNKTKNTNIKKLKRKQNSEERATQKIIDDKIKNLEIELDNLYDQQKILLDKTQSSNTDFIEINRQLTQINHRIKIIEKEWEKIS